MKGDESTTTTTTRLLALRRFCVSFVSVVYSGAPIVVVGHDGCIPPQPRAPIAAKGIAKILAPKGSVYDDDYFFVVPR